MPIKLNEYIYGERRRRGEGLRIGCTRYLVRGVRKKYYSKRNLMDVWLPVVAPSQKLLRWAKVKDTENADIWAQFLERYRNEMKKTAPRQTIHVLAKLASKTPISVGCYCSSSHCHRFELVKLIRAAAAGKL